MLIMELNFSLARVAKHATFSGEGLQRILVSQRLILVIWNVKCGTSTDVPFVYKRITRTQD